MILSSASSSCGVGSMILQPSATSSVCFRCREVFSSPVRSSLVSSVSAVSATSSAGAVLPSIPLSADHVVTSCAAAVPVVRSVGSELPEVVNCVPASLPLASSVALERVPRVRVKRKRSASLVESPRLPRRNTARLGFVSALGGVSSSTGARSGSCAGVIASRPVSFVRGDDVGPVCPPLSLAPRHVI